MRSWWKSLGMLAGGLVSLGGLVSSANAQFPPPGPGGYGMPPGGGMTGPPPGYGMQPGMMIGGGGPPPGMMMGGGGGPPPGAFGGNPNQGGMPAEFPNAAVPSQEPASPFSIKDEGFGGAFTELNDPRLRLPSPYTLIIRGEYIGWWITKARTNADLVTTTTAAAFTPTDFGALGQAGTQIVVPAGNDTIDYELLTGFRASVGLAVGFLPPIEVTGFAINRNLRLFEEGSNDATGRFLARPVQITNFQPGPNAGLETVSTITIPGTLSGNISIFSRLSFWGVDTNALINCIDGRRLKIDLLLGYRHTELLETLEINNRSGGGTGQIVFGGAVQPIGFAALVTDNFRTRNSFDGGQIGMRTILNFDKLTLFADAKIAMGTTYHQLNINGESTLFQPVLNRPVSTLPGGLLALPSNSAPASRTEFSAISEANVSLSYQLSHHIRIFGGYNLLYWSNVIRPGDHINSVIDARGVPTSGFFQQGAGTAPVTSPIVMRDLWAHGFNVGIEFGF